jgi:SSS family transporter
VGWDAIDLAVLVAYLGGVVALGLWVGRRQSSLDDYLLGARTLPWWAICGSIVATETSTASFLSLPGRTYVEGGDMRLMQLAIGYVIGRVLVSTALLPGYFRGRLVSAYELLGTRFGGSTRKLASATFLVTRTLGDGLRLFLAALALEVGTGFAFEYAVLAVGGATALYTVFGGMRSIVWNDCVQLAIYVIGGIGLCALAVGQLPGGWGELMEFGRSTGRFEVFDPSFDLSDPYTLWAGVLGGIFLTLGVHGTDQMLVQRYLSARDVHAAGRAVVVSGVIVALQFALFLLLGVALAADAVHAPLDGAVAGDAAVTSFVVQRLPSGYGLLGILVAAVLAASMSTLSSSLNSSASSVYQDWLAPRFVRLREPAVGLLCTRALTLLFAALQITVAWAARGVSSSVVTEVLAVAGFSAGLLLGLFGLAHLVPRARARDAGVGFALGLTVLLGLHLGPGVELAWTWLPLVGAVVVVVSGACTSCLNRTPRESNV